METIYRKVAVSNPSQFEHNKYYYFVDFDGNIQRDCFFNSASFDEYTHRYKYFLVEIPNPTVQLQADKEEILEALENSNYLIKSIKNDCSGSDLNEYYDVCVKIESENQSLIQKIKLCQENRPH